MKLPYLPPGKTIKYVPPENKWMAAAKNSAENLSLDVGHQTGAVLVKAGEIIGRGANGSTFHKYIGCVRKFLRIKTGKHYWLCSGCHPKNHAEQKAIKDAIKKNHDPRGADLYLYGHWWCCQSCWKKMIESGISKVYLIEKAESFYRR